MARYEITSPEGQRFEVMAPDGASQSDVLAYAASQFGAKAEEPQDGPLTRGWNKMIQSSGITWALKNEDKTEAAQRIAEAARYQQDNPGTPEGNELMAAWQRGDGISGGLKEVGGEFVKDWRSAPSTIAALRGIGRNVAAMGAGVVEQVPNMLPPMAGMIGGGTAGSFAGPVGTVGGAFTGASIGNTLVEGGGMAQESLYKAGITPTDAEAVKAYLDKNGDTILAQAGIKGAVIGAVDTATMGIAGKLLSGPARAATGRAMVDMGVDLTDKAAVKAAIKSPEIAARVAVDPLYKAATTGGQGVARNVTAAALEPAGEFTGEYLGQGIATGDYNEKEAFLEAASSIGQSGATFMGQKAYAAAKYPFKAVSSTEADALRPPVDEAGDMRAGDVLGTPDQQPNEAEAALYTPKSLTALDRVAEIDAALTKIDSELTKPDAQVDKAALQAERDRITESWPKAVPGAEISFSTESGARLAGQYALMEAGDLTTSHDESLRPVPTYPAELQPRERERHASEVQVQQIVQRLDPARLGESADVATGAPIVGADGLVESGNARTIALKRMYNGTRVPGSGKTAENYKQFLRDNADRFGIVADAVDSMERPVLVRVRTTPVNRAEFARQANAATVARMSPSELAKSDAAQIDSMDDLNPTEAGDFSSSSSDAFVRRFLAKLPMTEQAGLIDATGQLSQAGYSRIRNAVLAKAYGDSPVLLRMVESLDDNTRNVSKALLRVAPQVAKVREAIGEGALHDADVTPDLMAAVEKLSVLKEKGTSVTEALAQSGMFGDELSPETRSFLEFLDANIRSPRRIAEFIQANLDVLMAAGNPAQDSMFGDTAAPTKGDLMTAARRMIDGNQTAATTSGADAGIGSDGQEDRGQPEDAAGNQASPGGDEAAADFRGALSDLGAIVRDYENVARVVPEDTPGLMDTLVRLFDAAIRLGYHDAKKAVAYVKEQLKADPRFKTIWNKIQQSTYLKAATRAVDEAAADPGRDLFGQEGAGLNQAGPQGKETPATLPSEPAKESQSQSKFANNGDGLNDPDLSHLQTLEMRLSNERARLNTAAKSDGERAQREVLVKQIEKEISGERQFLGLAPAPEYQALSDDEILAELGETTDESSAVEFVKAPDGSIDFGEIPSLPSKLTGGKEYPAEPIRMEVGGDFGKAHIQPERLAAFQENGYATEAEMLDDVAKHYTHIYEQPNGRLLLVKRNGRAKFSVVELQPHGSYYGATTLFLEDQNPKGKPYEDRGGRVLLWPIAGAASSGSDATFPATTINAGAEAADAGESAPNIADQQTEGNPVFAAEARWQEPEIQKLSTRSTDWLRQNGGETIPVSDALSALTLKQKNLTDDRDNWSPRNEDGHPVKGVDLYTPEARRKLDAIGWAIHNLMDHRKRHGDAPLNAENAAEAPAETAPLSSVIDRVNAKHGADLGYADRIHTIAVQDDVMDRARSGNIGADEFKASLEGLIKNKPGIIAELEGMTKAAIFQRFPGLEYRYKNEKKSDVVGAAYHSMLNDFVLGDSISWSMGEKYEDVIRGYVEKTTDASLREFADQVKAAKEEREEHRKEAEAGMENPVTLDDYKRILAAKAKEIGEGATFKQARMAMTPEQRARFDELAAEETRSSRKAQADQQKTDVRAAAQTAEGQVIETKHTKTGEPLFVVKATERVEREVYNQWNATAKRLGGWYSSFRGNGAVPGFQFKTRENADAFLKYLGGDTGQAQEAVQARRDAFEDDRSQSASERLTEMAARLEDRADEVLGRDRKVNTDRRARMAESAEAQANADKALAGTMRNIARAIDAGTAKFLDRVRQKAQVEMLRAYAVRAKDAELRARYSSYGDREAHKGEPATGETADYIEFPQYTAYRSDLARMARRLLEIDGAKQLGTRLLKVSDDVTAEYKKFAKENLHKVSTFKTQDGKPAAFRTADDAEAAIARSGFKGKATTISFKRGEHLVIMGPEMAREHGIWQGDDDKRITLTPEFAEELVAKAKGRDIGMPWTFGAVASDRARLRAMGIETPAELRAAMREFVGLRELPAQADKVKQLERAMVGRRKDGLDFFPTPAVVADDMVEAAGIKEGMSVLEPSAGMGHIAERIREAGVEPDVVELSGERRELLEAKGFNVVGQDFTDLTREDSPGGAGYDRIIMNPPFSDRRDAEHVQHAYSLLKPGGRLVAIMGEGVFFGQDKKAQEFRDWLDRVGGTSEKLDEGTFLDPSLPVNTGVNARLVVVDKAGEGPPVSMLSRGGSDPASPATAIGEQDAVAVVDNIRAAFGSKARFTLHLIDSFDALPVEAQQDARDQGGNERNTYGLIHRDGSIWVIRENHSTAAALEETILHELRGHLGTRKLFGSQLVSKLNAVFDRLGGWGGLKVIAARYGEAEAIEQYRKSLFDPEKAPDWAFEVKVAVLTDELIARIAQQRPTFRTMINEAIGAIRQWLRKSGFAKLAEYGETDIARIIKLGERALTNPETARGYTVLMTDHGEEGAEVRLSRMDRSLSGRMQAEDVRAVVDGFRKAAKNLPLIHILQATKDAPRSVQKELRELDAMADAAGFYSADGQIYLFSSNLSSVEHAQRVFLHEAQHYGLDGLFGRALDETMMYLYKHNGGLKVKVDARQRADRTLSTVRAVEEVLADMAGAGKAKTLNGWDKVVASVREWFRKAGWVSAVTDNDVAYLVHRAELYWQRAQKGGYSNVKRGKLVRSEDDVRSENVGTDGMVLAGMIDEDSSRGGFGNGVRKVIEDSIAGRMLSSTPIHVMDRTPATLRALDWADLPVSMNPKEIDKVHFDHGMTADRIARLVPDTLERPSLMLRSATQSGRVVMVTNEYGAKPVLLVVAPDTVVDRMPKHLIVSMYPKNEGWDWVARQIRGGNLLYRDTQSPVAPKIAGAVADAQKTFAQKGRPLAGLIPESSAVRSRLKGPIPKSGPGFLSEGYKVLLPSDLRKFDEDARLAAINELEARHGDEIRKLFGIEPGALTANEAQYLLGFRTTDELRNRFAKAESERSQRLRSKGVLSESQDSPSEVAPEGRLSRSATAEQSLTPEQEAEAIIQQKAGTPRPLDFLMRKATQALHIDRLTTAAYEKAGALLDRYTPEVIKAGFVSDYGIPEAVIDQRAMMQGRQRQQLRGAGALLEKLSTLTRAESRVAYQWMNSADPQSAEYFRDQLPPESIKTLAEVEKMIDRLSREAVRLGQLSQDAFERNRFAYLHRSYVKHTAELTQKEAASRQRAISILGDQYKGRGMTDAADMAKIQNIAPEWWNRKLRAGQADKQLKGERFIRLERRAHSGEGTQAMPGMGEKGRGRLLEVAYWPAGEALPARYQSWDQAGTWEARDTKGAKLILWRDFTAQEREALGEIDEVRYAIAKTLHGMIHDVETGRYLEWLGQRYAKKDGEAITGQIVEASERMRDTFKPGEWVKVPESTVPGTTVSRYGSLAGRYLPGPIWNDVRQVVGFRYQPLGETYAAIHRAWKTSKTALSPAVHTNNVMANFVMADWHDVTAGHVLKALRMMLSEDASAGEVLARFEDSGGTIGTWATKELQQEQLRPLLDALEKELGMAASASGQVGVMSALQLVLHGRFPSAWEALKPSAAGKVSVKAARAMIDLYEAEDQVFRLAAWLKAKEDGAADLIAGKAARRSFLDYSINAPWVQMMRSTAFPFIAFTYRSVPMLLETAAKKPWKLMKLGLVAGALNLLGYALSGGDEDDERKLLPEEKAGRIWGIAPKLVRMPWNDAHGAPVFLDVRRWIPVGDIFDIGQGHAAIPALPAMTPGGPLAVLAELAFNKAQFTGRDITLETDTGVEKAQKVADHLYKAFAPNIVALPGTYAWTAVANAGSGKTDAFGREQSLTQALVSSVGIKVGSYPTDVLRLNAQREAQAKMMEIDRNITALKRERQRNGITEETFREKAAAQMAKKRKVVEEFQGRE